MLGISVRKEGELLKIDHLETSENAIFFADAAGIITIWSSGCEHLFGYPKHEVITKKDPPFILAEHLPNYYRSYQSAAQGKKITFILDAISKQEESFKIKMNISPVKDHQHNHVGYQGFFEKLSHHDGSKRTFSLIRNMLVAELYRGEKTINQMAVNTNINWKTVEKHLTHLMGKKLVEEIFSSRFVRIFGLSKQGKEYITLLQQSAPQENSETAEPQEVDLSLTKHQEVRRP